MASVNKIKSAGTVLWIGHLIGWREKKDTDKKETFVTEHCGL